MTTTAYEALAAKLVEVTAERDRARDVAVALEQQLARVDALAGGWEVLADKHVARAASPYCPRNEALIQTGVGGGRRTSASEVRAILNPEDQP